VVLLLLVLTLLRRRSQNPVRPLPSPTPVAQHPSLTPSPSPVQPPADGKISRLALTNLAGHQLIIASGTRLWLVDFTLQGPRKTLLLDAKYRILDLSLSPNRQWLAFTYTDRNPPGRENTYPPTGLQVMDLRDKTATEFISLDSQSIRYPVWSSDSLYLSVWNNGVSSVLFDMTNKRRVMDLPAIGGTKMGQIVFIPNQNKVSYVQNGNLYEVEYGGENNIQLIQGVSPVREVAAGPQLPDPPLYSTDGRFIAFHNSLSQLVLYDRQDGSFQTLAEGSGSYSFGEAITYSPDSRLLVYYNLKKEVYSPGLDDNPVYILRLEDKTGQPFFADRKTSISLTSPLPDSSRQKILFHDRGFQVFKVDGNMQSNCGYTGFGYSYYSWGGGLDYSTPLKVWTPDGRYILAASTRQIADTLSCAVSGPFDPDPIDLTIWVK